MDRFIIIDKLIKKVGKEVLVGDVFSTVNTPSVLFLHGGGITSSRKNFIQVRKALFYKGLSSISFDFSGHGDSSSNEVGSLSKRFHEASSWLPLLNKNKNFCILGYSMAAEIAIRLTASIENRFIHLILVVGALYSKDSFSVPFGNDFSSIIRVQDSWKKSESLKIIENFKGNLTVISAEHDEVIPRELHRMIIERAKYCKSVKHIIIPGIGHKISEECRKDKIFESKVISMLLNLI